MNRILVIVPTYNERENVDALQQAVLSVVPDADILFVDDHSPDGTGEHLETIRARESRVHVLHRSNKQGLGRAYIEGFKWGLAREYEFFFEMDADFSHDPRDIPRFVEQAQSADLVLGSRYVNGIRVINWPLGRLVLSRGAGMYVRLITGLPFTDPTSGFKCFRRAVLEDLDLDQITSNGYSFQIEVTHRAWLAGFHIVDMPITFEERRSGHSKMSTAIAREALWMVWKLWLEGRCRRSPRQPHPRSVRACR